MKNVNKYSEPLPKSFQDQVAHLSLRHRSFLDISSKYQEASVRVNRALMRAVTDCGCIEVQARRQPYTTNTDLAELKKILKTHLSGDLCDHCQEIIKDEVGKNLFYIAALCNLIHIDLVEVFEQELDKMKTLGVFNLR